MPRRVLYGAACCFLATLGVASWQEVQALTQSGEKPLFTRLVGPQTLMFQHSRVADFLKTPFVEGLLKQIPDVKEQMSQSFQKELGIAITDIEAVTMYVDTPLIVGGEISPPRPPYVMIHALKPINVEAVKAAIGESIKDINFGKYTLMAGSKRGVSFLNDRTMLLFDFMGSGSNADNAAKELPMYFAALDSGLQVPDSLKSAVEMASSNKHYGVTGFQLPKELRALLQEQLANVPPMMAPFKPLAQLQSGLIVVDYSQGAENDFRMKMQVRYPDAGSAKAALNAGRLAVASGKIAISAAPNRNDPDMKPVFDFLLKQIDAIKLETSEIDLVLDYQTNLGNIGPMLTSAIERVRNAADRMISASNMRQLMIAMHNYHNDFTKLPEAMTMKNGKPMHSWRVMMLPYIEQDNLFKQIKIDEPWDSEHNKKIFESTPMPKTFEHPGKKDGDKKMTYYKVFYSKPGVTPRAGFLLGKPTTLGQITVMDGTSNTAAMIEAGPPVLWYRPDDIEFDSKAQLPNMVSPWKDKKVSVAFFDASIRSFWLGTDEATWKGCITLNGEEVLDLSKIEEKK